MFNAEVDFKAMVGRIQTGEQDSLAHNSQERCLFATVKSVDQGNPNLIHATVSTDEIDRYDEIVLPSSFTEALSLFKKNPVLLAAHAHKLENGEPPVIGNVLPNSIKISSHQVDMDILFDDEDELAQKYARKYRKKIMRAFSIGFKGLEGKYEQSGEKKVWTWTKIELLEVSCVAVPANTGALSRAKRRKADFIADKIAQRQAGKNESLEGEDNAFGLIGLSRKDFTEEELADFTEEELAVLDLCLDEDEGKSSVEPDYGSIVKSTPSPAFYNE